MLQDTLRAEHLLVSDTVKLDFFGRVGLAVLDASSLRDWDLGLCLLVGLHR